MIDLITEERVEDLPTKRARKYFLQQYSLRKRNPGAVVAFALLFGGLGIHRNNNNRHTCGLPARWHCRLAVIIPPIVIGILSIIDACSCYSSSLVNVCNHKVADEIIDEIAALERCNDDGPRAQQSPCGLYFCLMTPQQRLLSNLVTAVVVGLASTFPF